MCAEAKEFARSNLSFPFPLSSFLSIRYPHVCSASSSPFAESPISEDRRIGIFGKRSQVSENVECDHRHGDIRRKEEEKGEEEG